MVMGWRVMRQELRPHSYSYCERILTALLYRSEPFSVRFERAGNDGYGQAVVTCATAAALQIKDELGAAVALGENF